MVPVFHFKLDVNTQFRGIVLSVPIHNLDLDGFLEFLKEKQGDQSDKQFAQAVGVSPQYLCDVKKGRRLPGGSLTSSLNVQRSTMFQIQIPDGEEE